MGFVEVREEPGEDKREVEEEGGKVVGARKAEKVEEMDAG